MVIHNHPYYESSHSPDIAVGIPVFHKGELVAFCANNAHHLDIGTATPGLIIGIPDVYAKGMLFAGTKALREGTPERGAAGGWLGECGISTSLTLGSAQERSNQTSWLIFDNRPGRRRVRQRDGAGLAGCFTCTPRQIGMSSAPCINALAHS